jgi:hypothetical protein
MKAIFLIVDEVIFCVNPWGPFRPCHPLTKIFDKPDLFTSQGCLSGDDVACEGVPWSTGRTGCEEADEVRLARLKGKFG